MFDLCLKFMGKQLEFLAFLDLQKRRKDNRLILLKV